VHTIAMLFRVQSRIVEEKGWAAPLALDRGRCPTRPGGKSGPVGSIHRDGLGHRAGYLHRPLVLDAAASGFNLDPPG
jgi:hypothetical protein